MRRKDREITDPREIVRLLECAKTIRIAMFDDAYPYIVPMNFGYALEGDRLLFALHSARAGKKLELLRANPRVAFELDVENGLDEAAHPCNYGFFYECILGRGTVRFAQTHAEKEELLGLIMKHQAGRTCSFTETETATVEVFALEVETFSAKAQRPAAVRL